MGPSSEMIRFLAEDRIKGFKNEAATYQLAKRAQTAYTRRRSPGSKRLMSVLLALINRVSGIR